VNLVDATQGLCRSAETMGAEYFIDSPFSLTASMETAACWAGRKETMLRLQRLHRSFSTRADSSLDLVWANFGAGKSHALLHLAHLVASDPGSSESLIPIFVEMPDQLRRFTDLYERIVKELPSDKIAARVLACKHPLPQDLRRWATAVLNGGPSERSVAQQWLHAQRPSLRELKSATGITQRLEDDTATCDVLTAIIAAMADGGMRLLVLLDEFQRAALLQPQRRREAILSNIRTIFSHNSKGFSMVLAIASRMEQSAMDMVPNELRTLLGMRPGVSLPEMSEEEAVDFVLGRFLYFRPKGYSLDEAAPFGVTAIRAIISYIGQKEGARLIPRTILQALAWIYDSATPSAAHEISKDDVSQLLGELRWDKSE
jgi:hypothetical protein